MKPSDILQNLFIICIMVFLAGLFGGPDISKTATLALCAIGFLAIVASWRGMPSIAPNRRQALYLAIIDAFVFLIVLLLAILILKGFIFTSISLDYAIFGTLFLTILMVRLLAFRVLDQ